MVATHHTIYKITNLSNNKIYIGLTSHSVTKRLAEHISCAISKKDNRRISQAIRDDGAHNFIIEALASVIYASQYLNTFDYLLEREVIEQYNSENPAIGYNSALLSNREENLTPEECLRWAATAPKQSW